MKIIFKIIKIYVILYKKINFGDYIFDLINKVTNFHTVYIKHSIYN
jgi:hypothetical protein